MKIALQLKTPRKKRGVFRSTTRACTSDGSRELLHVTVQFPFVFLFDEEDEISLRRYLILPPFGGHTRFSGGRATCGRPGWSFWSLFALPDALGWGLGPSAVVGVDLGAGVGVRIGFGAGVDVGAGVCVDVSAGIGVGGGVSIFTRQQKNSEKGHELHSGFPREKPDFLPGKYIPG